MLHAFAIIGEYDEITPMFRERYGGLVDGMHFSIVTANNAEQTQLLRIVRRQPTQLPASPQPSAHP